MKNKMYLIKVIGLAATLIGAGAALVSEWVDKQELSELINERIDQAFTEREEEEEEEEES